MIAPTHITFAEFLYLLILTTTGIALSPVNAIVIGIASLLADIDTEVSTIGKLLPFVSKRIERKFGHRTLTHSILAIVVTATASIPLLLIEKDLYVCIVAGYASHPFLDTMTVNGVKLFFPFSNLKCVFPLEVNQPHRYRVQTGSKVDKLLAVLFFLGCIPTFFISNQGYERFVRFTQRSVEAAVRDYNEFSKTHSVFADVTAHDLLTKERLVGKFEIVGALDNHTLLFKGSDGQLHTLGREYKAEYAAQNVLCEKATPVQTSVRSIDMTNQTLGLLSEHSSEATLFFGTVRSKEKFSLPMDETEFSTIKGTPNHLVRNYASLNDFRKFGLDNLLIEQGILIARTQTPITSTDTATSESNRIASQFSEVSFIANPDQSIRLLVQIGDTVSQGGHLAEVAFSDTIHAQIALNLTSDFSKNDAPNSMNSSNSTNHVVSGVEPSTNLAFDLRSDLIFMGRKEELYQLTHNLQQGRHTLLFGDKGIGKTRLMQEARWILEGRASHIDIASRVTAQLKGRLGLKSKARNYKIIYVEHPNPLSECLKELAEQLHRNGDFHLENEVVLEPWEEVKKKLRGLGSSKLQAKIFGGISQSDKPYLIFFDNLDRVSPSQHAFLEKLLGVALVCTAVVEIKEHFVYKRIWSSFARIDLEPLPEEICVKLINHFFDNYPIHIIDRELYRTEILKAANGNPFFIKNMLWHGMKEKYVTLKEIRQLRRVQEGHYFNMGPDYIFSASIFTIFKIFSLGTDNKEFYIYFSALGVLVYLTFRIFRAFFLFRPQKYDR